MHLAHTLLHALLTVDVHADDLHVGVGSSERLQLRGGGGDLTGKAVAYC